MDSMRVICWGTRGLVSSPGRTSAVHGGNTSFIEIRASHTDELVLVDSGFGLCNLGEKLVTSGAPLPRRIHILYTHFHWDHTQGLPFFQPIYDPNVELFLHSPWPKTETFQNLDILFDGSYSPFEGLASMESQISLVQLTGPSEVAGFQVDYAPCDHLQDGAYAYRFTDPVGASLCIVTDHEARPSEPNEAIVRFATDCDLLIHDAQWSDAEYVTQQGHGHSTADQALANALRCRAGKTLLTHHAPWRTDRELQELHRKLRQNANYGRLDFEFAREEVDYLVRGVSLERKLG